jgi:hypothetical protein
MYLHSRKHNAKPQAAHGSGIKNWYPTSEENLVRASHTVTR